MLHLPSTLLLLLRDYNPVVGTEGRLREPKVIRADPMSSASVYPVFGVSKKGRPGEAVGSPQTCSPKVLKGKSPTLKLRTDNRKGKDYTAFGTVLPDFENIDLEDFCSSPFDFVHRIAYFGTKLLEADIRSPREGNESDFVLID